MSHLVNLVGLSAMFSSNQFSLTTKHSLFQYQQRIRDVLDKNHRANVIGMYVEEAVRMYIDNGWKTVEVIEDGIPQVLLKWAEKDETPQPDRMRLWVKDNKVWKAVSG